MTQKILASLVGVRQAAISRIENNDRFPSTEVLVKLAVVLGISLDDLAPTVDEIKEKKDAAAVTP